MSVASGFIGPVRPMDPAHNNMPLQFDANKGKPPLPVESDSSANNRRLQKYDKNTSRDDDPSSTTSSHSGLYGPMMPQAGYMSIGPMGYPGPMMGPPDPNSMMFMAQMGQIGFGQFGGFMGPMGPYDEYPNNDIITLPSCTLYPPPPGAPLRSTRERPPWCKTIFIGGTPEKATEEMLREIFEVCGPILHIRLNKKNFAHIRFASEDCVDRALFFSGHRMKIDNSDEKEMTGRLHVDFAEARDDQYDWECQQRILAREMRHRQRLEEEQLRPPSPPPISHYNEHESSLLAEKLKSADTFSNASQVLITWLERGDCTRRSSSSFFTLIQCTNTNIRRLLTEKDQLELDLAVTKNRVQQGFSNILRQFDQVEKVFAAALKQKCWDHFTKAQRKSIDMWANMTKKIHATQCEALLNERQEDEMDLSDDEEKDPGGGGSKRRKVDSVILPITPITEEDLIARSREYAKSLVGSFPSFSASEKDADLKEENDALKCQLEAYKNEIDLVKQEYQTLIDKKDRQIRDLQNALQGMQQQLIRIQQQARQAQKEVEKQGKEDKEEALHSGALSEPAENSSLKQDSQQEANESVDKTSESKEVSDNIEATYAVTKVHDDSVSSTGVTLSSKEAHILGLICCFLHVHPSGATVDYLWSYLSQLIPMAFPLRPRELEDLLERLPGLFRLEMYGIGANLERRWIFIGYSERSCLGY